MKGFLVLIILMMLTFLWFSGGGEVVLDFYDHILWEYTRPGEL